MSQFVITRLGSPEDRAAKLYWCVYASGDRWNNRPSHAKKFDTVDDARAYAETSGFQDFDVEVQK